MLAEPITMRQIAGIIIVFFGVLLTVSRDTEKPEIHEQ
jgi:drug/metabolite transporter (DMT)-like permease